MKTSINSQIKNVIVLAFIIVALGVNAQSFRKQKSVARGFDVSFGTSNTMISSNIDQLSNLRVVTEGGNAGFFYGNEKLISTVTVGFHYSASSVAQTVDMFSASKNFNFYPLGNSRVRPYISGGVGYNVFKFAGHYLDTEKKNYSVVNETYIGKINQFNVAGGLGVEYVVGTSGVSIYGEAKYSSVISQRTTREEFKMTNVGNQMTVSIGVRYGIFGR